MTRSAWSQKAAVLGLVAFAYASCTSPSPSANATLPPMTELPAAPTNTPSYVSSDPTVSPTSPLALAGFGFPAEIDPSERYLFYLHGRIIEDQGIPAISPGYGEYRYEDILKEFQENGFVVISELRPRNTDGWEYARRTARQVTDLLTAGVPPGSITVVGASKGASIATVVSYLVGNLDVNYVLLGSCHPSVVDDWLQQDVTLSGNVLAIYDFADDEYSGSCEDLFNISEDKGINRHEEIVLQVGTGHGILYEPLPEWVLPTIRWAQQQW